MAIRVRVELISACTGKTTLLGQLIIANDGSGDQTHGNYWFRLSRRNQPTRLWRAGTVRGFPRARLGPWDLLFRTLYAAVGERNVPDVARGKERR